MKKRLIYVGLPMLLTFLIMFVSWLLKDTGMRNMAPFIAGPMLLNLFIPLTMDLRDMLVMTGTFVYNFIFFFYLIKFIAGKAAKNTVIVFLIYCAANISSMLIITTFWKPFG